MAKAQAKAIPVPYRTLIALLGKTPKDPDVIAAMGKAGKVTFKSDFIVAKEAGFDYSLGKPTGGKQKVLSSLFLFPDGGDKHRGYEDLPPGFSFTTREALLATLPEPESSWKLGKGKVPASTPDVLHDTWTVGGVKVTASYRKGEVGHLNVSLPEALTGGRDFSSHPLHFETKPADAPPDAELVGMALLVAWAAERFGLPAKHATSTHGKELLARSITPRAFLIAACDSRLSSLDFDPKLDDFLYAYLHGISDDEDVRTSVDKVIAKLLHLKKSEDGRAYHADFLGTFAKAVDNPFHVPDSWDAVDRIAPILDARWADYGATSFDRVPDLKLYEQAARLRDARSITPARKTLGRAAVDAALADDLIALIGRSLKDPQVKAVLTRAGMRIGKTIDQQANPALGIAYMGTKFEIDGKRQLGVDAVWFFANKQKSYIRGIGAEVEFVGYPGPLPRGLALGEPRAAVIAKLGKPTSADDESGWWKMKGRVIRCEFKRGKLVELSIGQPKDY